MAPVQQLGMLDVVFYIGIAWVTFRLFTATRARWSGIQTTPLRGPSRKSLIFGVSREVNLAEDPAILYEQWANEYGPAYWVPRAFGNYKIMLMDPKAIAHFYSKETLGYVQTKPSKMFIEALVSKLGYGCAFLLMSYVKFGRGLLTAEGESHRRLFAIYRECFWDLTPF
jgi:hypothetical protein